MRKINKDAPKPKPIKGLLSPDGADGDPTWATCECGHVRYDLLRHLKYNKPYTRCEGCHKGPSYFLEPIRERISRSALRYPPPKSPKREPRLTKFASEIADAILPAINALKDRTHDEDDPHQGGYAAMSPPDDEHPGPWLYVDRWAAVVEVRLIPIADSYVDEKQEDKPS